MALDNVPWLVAGGAEHSAEVGRTLAYVAVGGAEGVAESADLVVSPLSVPGGSVRVGAGACAITNTYASQASQSYIARVISDTNIAVAPTGGVPRSDLVVIRIDDPEFGGSAPADPAVGPYVKLEIISDVGSSITEVPESVPYPAVALARLDIPASTATITSPMVKDLRKVIRPRSERVLRTQGDFAGNQLVAASPTYASWPDTTANDIDIPAWATKMVVIVTVTAAYFQTAGGAGLLRVKLGTDGSAITTEYGAYNTIDQGGSSRADVTVADTINIPAAYRGTPQALYVQGTVQSGGSTTRPKADSATGLIIDVQFIEAAAAA